MASLDLFLLRKLQERLEEETRNYSEAVLNGSAATYEDYKYRVGYLKGLSDALIWAKEINDELIGVKQKAR
jgi:hypothetical protein